MKHNPLESQLFRQTSSFSMSLLALVLTLQIASMSYLPSKIPSVHSKVDIFQIHHQVCVKNVLINTFVDFSNPYLLEFFKELLVLSSAI